MQAVAIVLSAPNALALEPVTLAPPTDDDVVVDMEWSGVSTGTERLLWSGRMPHFPGMGYPLVPGYESVGLVVSAGATSGRVEGSRVFVPGARCYRDVKALFGGASSRVVVPGARALPLSESLGEEGVLLALAATAVHALALPHAGIPDLIVGHGVLGRLLARLSVSKGGSPTVWERNPARRDGVPQGDGAYSVLGPEDDPRRDYRAIYDVSGDSTILPTLIARLAPGGEIVLAGFYETALSFDFPPAFLREASIRIAAEFKEHDLRAAHALVERGGLSLGGLITHSHPASAAPTAYPAAFADTGCLKMVLDWRSLS